MLDFQLADLDGDGRTEVIVRYGKLHQSVGPVFDIVRAR